MIVGPVDRFWTAPASAPRPGAAAARDVESAGATATSEAARGLPVDPPAHTDAQLWSVLTSTERTFFARAGSRSGTYGPSGLADALASQGLAVDLRA